jgi:hypothetical protein
LERWVTAKSSSAYPTGASIAGMLDHETSWLISPSTMLEPESSIMIPSRTEATSRSLAARARTSA